MHSGSSCAQPSHSMLGGGSDFAERPLPFAKTLAIVDSFGDFARQQVNQLEEQHLLCQGRPYPSTHLQARHGTSTTLNIAVASLAIDMMVVACVKSPLCGGAGWVRLQFALERGSSGCNSKIWFHVRLPNRVAPAPLPLSVLGGMVRTVPVSGSGSVLAPSCLHHGLVLVEQCALQEQVRYVMAWIQKAEQSTSSSTCRQQMLACTSASQVDFSMRCRGSGHSKRDS